MIFLIMMILLFMMKVLECENVLECDKKVVSARYFLIVPDSAKIFKIFIIYTAIDKSLNLLTG